MLHSLLTDWHASIFSPAPHLNIANTRSTPQTYLLGYRLKVHSLRGGARAVLLAPTRELALQTHKVVKELSRYTNLRTAVLVGGDSMEAQFAELAANPDIIVATPGAHPEAPDFALHIPSLQCVVSRQCSQYCLDSQVAL